jgi:hypothetical protein
MYRMHIGQCTLPAVADFEITEEERAFMRAVMNVVETTYRRLSEAIVMNVYKGWKSPFSGRKYLVIAIRSP